MSQREAFLRLLAGEAAGRWVWTADLTYWISGRQQDGTADPAWQTETGYLELHRRLGVMPYFWYPDFAAGRPRFGPAVECRTERTGDLTVRFLRTPAGELREESRFVAASCSQAITRHFVNTADDLRVLLSAVRHRRVEPVDLRAYRARCERWAAYDGLPSLGLPRSPLSAFFYEWAGVQNGVFLLYDCPDETAELLALLAAQEQDTLEAVAAAAPPLLHFPDNLTSDNLTSFFAAHYAPHYRRRLAVLRPAGVRTAVHLDGTVRGLLPKLAAVGLDAVEALTPRPAGDVALGDLRALAGNDRVILWGGLPGAMFAPPFTWRDMAAHLETLVATWAGQRVVVGVADQVPPDGDLSFCRRIADFLAARG